MHRFLLIVAQPAMRCPVDVVRSLEEVIRVTKEEAALMAILDGKLVGTMGLIKPSWWYGNGTDGFLTDRWHFCLPQYFNGPVNDALINEAKAIASAAGIEFIHQGKARERNGIVRMMPRVYPPTETE